MPPQVAAGVDDLHEGESMVLTLKDSRILDEAGADVAEGEDELENVRLTELRSRERARAAAAKPRSKPAGTGEGEGAEAPRRLLAKYDEAEAPAAMALDAQARGREIQRCCCLDSGG